MNKKILRRIFVWLCLLIIVFSLQSVFANGPTTKPLPGVNFNYAHPLFPCRDSVGSEVSGMIIPLSEGSGTPRAYLTSQQYTTASTTTERLCTLTGAKWNPYPTANAGRSDFSGPTLSLLSTTDKVDLGINSDFLDYSNATIIMGYQKRSAADDYQIATETTTANQICLVRVTSVAANFFWGGTGAPNLLTAFTTTTGYNVWAFSVGPRGMEIYQNGSLIGSNGNTPTRANNTQNLILGGFAFWGNTDLGDFSFVYFYPNQLSRDEIVYISTDPFCFYDWGEDQLLGPASARKGDFFSPIIPPLQGIFRFLNFR